MKSLQVTNFVLIGIFSWGVISGCAASKNSTEMLPGKSQERFKVQGREICIDSRTGKMWQKGKEGGFHSYEDAQQYVNNLQLGGYSDWRLPTKSELFDLHNVFFLKKNGNCTMKRTGEYWSTDKKDTPALGHWETYHLCGPGFKYVKSVGSKGYVRAIRQTKD